MVIGNYLQNKYRGNTVYLHCMFLMQIKSNKKKKTTTTTTTTTGLLRLT